MRGEPLRVAQPFDIFRIQTEGGVCWIGSAENLEAAKMTVKAASAKEPRDFLIVSLETGWKTEIKAEPAA
jgi:hypothetical protein